MISAVYIGEIESLRGERALIQPLPGMPGSVQAQFSNMFLSMDLTHSWTVFPEADFHPGERTDRHEEQLIH